MSDSTADLVAELAEELQRLPMENAVRLASILQGLFACMRDLNERVSSLEDQQMAAGDAAGVN
jgi:hypothetical protein